MKVLSLFDGISCGMVALERAGIEVDRYVAYEIDDNAIKVSKKNYPNIEHCGDVITADFKEYIGFDLLIGGSPCQCLSSANVYIKDGEYGVCGEGVSRLFWEYVRALKIIKPRFFLFENVASMRKVDKKIITEQLGVEPIRIDSQLFSAQKRNRLYWTNIPFQNVTERQTHTTLPDILEDDVADKYFLKQGTLDYIMKPSNKGWQSGEMNIDLLIARPIVSSSWKMHRADTDNYITSKRSPEGRSNIRRLTPVECERLQTLPDNYTDGISDNARIKCIGNGWTVDVIAYILSGINSRLQGE
mgnify:CR=1 FL=1